MNGVMWVVLFDCSCGSSTKMPRMGSLLSPPSRASPVMAGFTKVCGLRPLPVLSVVLLSPPSRASPVMVVFVNVCGLRPLPVLSVVLLSPPSRASPVMAGFPKVCGLRPLQASSDACTSAAVGVGAGDYQPPEAPPPPVMPPPKLPPENPPPDPNPLPPPGGMITTGGCRRGMR